MFENYQQSIDTTTRTKQMRRQHRQHKTNQHTWRRFARAARFALTFSMASFLTQDRTISSNSASVTGDGATGTFASASVLPTCTHRCRIHAGFAETPPAPPAPPPPPPLPLPPADFSALFFVVLPPTDAEARWRFFLFLAAAAAAPLASPGFDLEEDEGIAALDFAEAVVVGLFNAPLPPLDPFAGAGEASSSP